MGEGPMWARSSERTQCRSIGIQPGAPQGARGYVYHMWYHIYNSFNHIGGLQADLLGALGGFGRWPEVAQLVHDLDHSVQVHWPPLHNKEPVWRPPVENLGEAGEWRRQSKAADEEAGEGAAAIGDA